MHTFRYIDRLISEKKLISNLIIMLLIQNAQECIKKTIKFIKNLRKIEIKSKRIAARHKTIDEPLKTNQFFTVVILINRIHNSNLVTLKCQPNFLI